MTEPANPRPPDTVDSSFRNGTLTVIGIVSAFSLGFLTRWAGVSGPWSRADFVTLVVMLVGITLQIKALYDFLDVRSLQLPRYRASARWFKVGLAAMVVGVAMAVFADILGLKTTLLRE